jgi:hypothetical protein
VVTPTPFAGAPFTLNVDAQLLWQNLSATSAPVNIHLALSGGGASYLVFRPPGQNVLDAPVREVSVVTQAMIDALHSHAESLWDTATADLIASWFPVGSASLPSNAALDAVYAYEDINGSGSWVWTLGAAGYFPALPAPEPEATAVTNSDWGYFVWNHQDPTWTQTMLPAGTGWANSAALPPAAEWINPGDATFNVFFWRNSRVW